MSVAKIAIIAALLTLATVALYSHGKTQNVSNDVDFQTWKIQYKKAYGGAEEAKRAAIFNENKAIIATINAEDANRTYTLGVNQFSDLTNEEFSAIYLGFNAEASETNNTESAIKANPVSVDHRNTIIGAVKNQAACGSCWAFSTIAGLEGLQAQTTGSHTTLSEQQLVDCSTANNGCNGGLMTSALTYTAANGVVSDSDYSYKGVDGKCKASSYNVVFKNKAYQNVAVNNWQALESAVANQVVSVAISAGNSVFQHYTGGVINSVGCGTALDHGVAAVGYDGEAWIVRNSWGPAWGEAGHVRIAKGNQANGAGICGINKMATYPTA